jgi:hypothetical protein
MCNKQAHILYWASEINKQFLLNLKTLARLEVFIAVKLRIMVFCNMMLQGAQHFKETYVKGFSGPMNP